jgi:hypothetical protein
MNVAARALILASDWSELRTQSGTAGGVPTALADLSQATSDESAENAYWRIDNEVIVQGELYQAALPTLEVLLALASKVSSGPARRWLAELVQQIVCGQTHESETAAGNGDLAVRCRASAQQALWLFYGWLSDVDRDVRACALLTLQHVEDNVARRRAIFQALRLEESDDSVRKVFTYIDRGIV